MYEEIFESLSPCPCGCTPQIAIDNKRNSVAVVCEHCRYEARAESAEMAAELWEQAIAVPVPELRYNPYHDPTNGRFTGPNGAGGGYLFVGKGQKGKGSYVVDSKNFGSDDDFDDEEYAKWHKTKSSAQNKASGAEQKINVVNQGTTIYNTDYATPDDYKKALAEKYNGITDVSKIKTARDVSDFINYDTQSQYYATHGSSNAIQSTWRKGVHALNTNEFGFGEEVSPVRDAGFSSNGTTVFEMPKGYGSFKNNTHVFDGSIAKLEKAGIGVGHWFDDTYMITKKKGARTSKWLEGLRAFDDDELKLLQTN